jgi:DNA-binding NtrC family response regulator
MARSSRGTLRTLFRTRNRALAREIDSLERAADLPSTILILGESGTGKDRLARALHDVSLRAARPFVRVDAANLSDELFESELFGHERGAFTGAIASKKGLLEVAEDGTVYLDEVSSLSPAAQAKFLRVIQEKNFRRLSGVTTHPFRARLIVSSRRDLATLVEQGTFRDDLFYRIDVISVRLPRLSDRREDVLLLARAFMRRAARSYHRPARRFAREAEETLLRHHWPGNVRELLNVMEGELALLPPGENVLSAVPEALRRPGSGPWGLASGRAEVERFPLLSEIVRKACLEAVTRHGGNVSSAARALGISKGTLYRKIGSADVKPSDLPGREPLPARDPEG